MGKAKQRKRGRKVGATASTVALQPTVEDLELTLMEYLEPPEVAAEYKRAIDLLGSGQIAEAVGSLDQLRQGLKEVSALLIVERLAQLYIEHGAIHPALEIFRQIDQDEKAPDVRDLNILAMEYAHVKRYDEQRRLYIKRGQQFGDSARNRVEIAWTHELEGRLDLAREELERAWKDYPETSFAAQQLILLYLRLGLRDKATEMGRAILRLEAQDEATQFDKAIAALILRRPKEALQHLEMSQGSPEDPFRLYYTALANLMLGNAPKAKELLDEMAKHGVEIWDQDEEVLARSFLTAREYDALVRLWPKEED